MERFMVFFRNCSIENAISKAKENLVSKFEKQNLEINFDLKSIVLKLIDNPNQLNEFVLFLQKSMDLEFLLVIDNKKDICYIYVAKGSLKDIKETTMTDISEVYKIITNDELFVSNFEDLRCVSKICQKNTKLN